MKNIIITIFCFISVIGSFLFGDYCDLWFNGKMKPTPQIVYVDKFIDVKPNLVSKKMEAVIKRPVKAADSQTVSNMERTESAVIPVQYPFSYTSDSLRIYGNAEAVRLTKVVFDSVWYQPPPAHFQDTVHVQVECPQYERTWIDYSVLVLAVYGAIKLGLEFIGVKD